MDFVSPTIINLIIFVLAIYVGYHVVWTVTPALHTPLMAVTNAISAIVIVGAMLAAALTETTLGKTMGVLAVALAAVNIFGGFLVTRRMLEMFKEERPARQADRGEEVMSLNVVTLLYLVASVCFIQALKGLSHPTTSIRGNLFGMIGMAIAVLTTAALIVKLAGGNAFGMSWVLLGLVVGGAYGAWRAKTVEMTKMPELVAFFHSMIGLAAVFIAVAAVAEPWAFGIVAKGEPIPAGNRLELFLGAAIGAITFSGSVIAFGKLSGTYKFRLFKGAPVVFAGQHMLNLVLGIATIGLGLAFMFTGSWPAFFAMLALSFVLGVLIIIPIGGADMPVVVSMLNSYSGWAAAGIGFSLNNSMLIIAGSLVGSSGAILSYIMCKAMNRSFFNVILGGFGAEPGAAVQGAQEQRPVKSGSADDAAFVLGNAETVVIVPGYGLAVARAQHAVKELAEKLTRQGHHGQVRHPPGGRPHAGPHERAARRGRGALRPGVRDGGHQRRVRPGRRGHRARRQRRREPGRADQGNADLRHAHPRGLQGQDDHRQQALDGRRLRGPGQRAVLHGQDDDGVRRREEGRRGHGQGGGVGTTAALRAKRAGYRNAAGLAPGVSLRDAQTASTLLDPRDEREDDGWQRLQPLAMAALVAAIYALTTRRLWRLLVDPRDERRG